MFKFAVIVLMAMVCVSAKPGGLFAAAPLAYSAPLVAAPAVVTAHSSQFIARNYNGLAAAPLVAAAAPVAYTAAAAPLAYASSPYISAPAAYAAYSPYVL